MSYAMAGLGQTETNSSTVAAASVSNGWTDPWLDADLEVQNINAVDASRVPREVRQALLDSGAEVDSVAWDSRGKVHVMWKPNATYNAVDYANVAKRIFAQAARARLGGPSFGASARIVMPRYRINNRLSAVQYVYPTSAALPASAPLIARMPTPEESAPSTPAPPVTASPVTSELVGNSLVVGTAAVAVIGLVGTAIYMSRRPAKVRRNRHNARRRSR